MYYVLMYYVYIFYPFSSITGFCITSAISYSIIIYSFNKYLLSTYYNWPFMSAGSTNLGRKMFTRKIFRKFQRAKLEFFVFWQILHNIHIVLGIISDLEIFKIFTVNMCRSYANKITFGVRDLSIHKVWYP